MPLLADARADNRNSNSVENRIGAELFIRGENAKQYFALLLEQKEEIEQEIRETLSWEDLPERIGCRIAFYKDDVDPTKESDWQEQHQWMADTLMRFDRVFRPRVRSLDIEDSDISEAVESGEAST